MACTASQLIQRWEQQGLHDIARAVDGGEERPLKNVMRGQRAAHQPDVSQRTGACQLCSSAMLGEELCFRHTTIIEIHNHFGEPRSDYMIRSTVHAHT